MFESLEINGVTVPKEHYTLKEGSTIITLKNRYLNTLTVGTYEVKAFYSDGKVAEMNFSIKEAEPDDNDDEEENTQEDVTEESNTDVNEPTKKEEVSLVSPQTGDTGNNFNAWIFIFLGALAGFVGVNVVGYRKEHNK